MRKRTLVIVAIFVALSLFVFTGTALARTAPVGSASRPLMKGDSNGSATQFTANYYNGFGGYFSCSGVRVVNKNFTKDTETCSMSNVSTWPAGEYIGNPYFYINGVREYWISDYDGQIATTFRGEVTDNGDGTGTLELVAIY